MLIKRWLAPLCGLLMFSAFHESRAELPDFTGLVESVSPAVVNISATQTVRAGRGPHGMPYDEEEIPEIFKRFLPPQGQPELPRERTSIGTGFLISSDGYLLTNHHVVDGADDVYVRLTDRRELKAKVVGSDEQSDVALLKLEGKDFPALQLGDSKALKPGQWVVAIGSPFGFDHSVTAGIVSAVGRASFDRAQQYVPFIQTDVAINRGNSGGPLMDTQGRVVGINSQIFSNTGGFMGVSFAIPIEVAMRSVEQLKAKGYVARGLLGVNIEEVTREKAEALGLGKTGGALVSGFSKDSAARKAGVEVQDVIVEFDGAEIRSAADLPPLVGATVPGSKVKLKVLRNGKPVVLDVVVGELPRDASRTASTGGGGDESASLGLLVEDLSEEQRQELELDTGKGVVISRVVGESALRAGLRPGDIVLMVGRTAVGSAEAFAKAAAVVPDGKPVLLLVRRGDATQFVTIAPEAQGE